MMKSWRRREETRKRILKKRKKSWRRNWAENNNYCSGTHFDMSHNPPSHKFLYSQTEAFPSTLCMSMRHCSSNSAGTCKTQLHMPQCVHLNKNTTRHPCNKQIRTVHRILRGTSRPDSC